MAPTIKNVAISGATGNVGTPILDALLADRSFTVTVLVRSGSATAAAQLPAGVRTVAVDFTSLKSLTEALRGQHAAINATAAPAPEDHLRFTEAASAAGVYRHIPAYFSLEVATTLNGDLPVFAAKAAVLARSQEIAASPPADGAPEPMTWTFVTPGPFLDWNLTTGFLGIDIRARTATITSGGDLAASHTLLRDVGRAVVGVLRRPDETRNRQVRVQSVFKSQNELLALARRALRSSGAGAAASEEQDDGWRVTAEDGRERFQWALDQMAAGNYEHDVWMHQIRYAAADPKYNGPWESVDNELFGIKELSDDEAIEIIQTLVREDKVVY